MAVKARNVVLNTSSRTLLEAPQQGMKVVMRTDGDVVVGGADLAYPLNGWALSFFAVPASVVLERGDDLYAQAVSGTPTLSYIAIGD